MKVLDIFNPSSNYHLSLDRVRYYSSLIPEEKIFSNCEKIIFNISLFSPPEKNVIKLQNMTNIHLFKPRYFINNKNPRELICYVPSEDVFYHTLKALGILGKLIFNKNPLIEINKEKKHLNCGSIIKNWQVKDLVLIGRIETIINFLRMIWLLENKIKKTTVKKIFTKLEALRLFYRNKDIGKRTKEIFKFYNIDINYLDKKNYQLKIYPLPLLILKDLILFINKKKFLAFNFRGVKICLLK